MNNRTFTIEVGYAKAKFLCPYLHGEDLEKALALIEEVERDRYSHIDIRLQDVARSCDICNSLVIRLLQAKNKQRRCIVCRKKQSVVYSIGPTPLSQTFICLSCDASGHITDTFEEQMKNLGVKTIRRRQSDTKWGQSE